MANYNEIYALRNDATLKEKVTVAVSKAAQDVINESSNTANHVKRAIWAAAALRNAEAMADAMMWSVLGNASIQTTGSASPDGDVQFVVNSLVDIFAGV